MALGKPVIATAGGGTPELVENGKTGFLIKDNNPKEIAQRIIELIDNPARAGKMGAGGSHRIREKFSMKKIVTDHLKLYTSLQGKFAQRN